MDAYTEGEIDELYIATNSFVNSMTQSPVIERLLPLQGPTKAMVSGIIGITFTSPKRMKSSTG